MLFVSVDPNRDTPERIAAYLKGFDPEFSGVTAPDAELAPLLKALGVAVEKHEHGGANYNVVHNSDDLRDRPRTPQWIAVTTRSARPRPSPPTTCGSGSATGASRVARRMTCRLAVATPAPEEPISAVIYRVARSERAWLKRPLMGWFARTYRVDIAKRSTPISIATRRSTTSSRAHCGAARGRSRAIASTVVVARGRHSHRVRDHRSDTLLQAKGRSYSLAALLGESGAAVDALRRRSYCTIYLAPHNYHRVHAPLGGALERTRYIPGRRFSVSRATAAAIDRLFCRNERVACWFDTGAGPMVVVLVGALNVSSVSTFNRGEIASGAARHWQEDPPVPIERGAEIGRFNLGSTVIVLFAPGAVRWDPRLADGIAVAMGTQLGRIEDRAAQVD